MSQMAQPWLVHEGMAWKQRMGQLLVWVILDKAFFFTYKVKKLDYQDIQIFPSHKSSTTPLKNPSAYMSNKKPIIFQEENLYVCLHSTIFFMHDKF